MGMNDELIIVLVTCPPAEAENLAGELVREKLAACVNILPAKSVYYWQDKLCRDDEAVLIIKSRQPLCDQLETRIKQLHSYELPEIVAIKADMVEQRYWNWVQART